MKVVAQRSFFGSGISLRKGRTYEVKDKVAKAWLEAGWVSEADGDAPATATTSTPKAPTTPSTPAKSGSEPKGDEVVTDPENTTAKPTGEPTGNGDTTVTKSTDDATTTTKVATNPTTSVKPDVANTKPNETKVSK